MTGNGNTNALTLMRAYEIGKRAGLRYIYPGNIPGAFGDLESTHCPKCDTVVIGRSGFRVTSCSLVDGKCPKCATAIPGKWDLDAVVGRSGDSAAGVRGGVARCYPSPRVELPLPNSLKSRAIERPSRSDV